MNIAENIIKNSTRDVKTEDVDIIPLNSNVIVEFYKENPYRKIDISDKGIIFDLDANSKYKSSDSGEIEESDEAIGCAKVIAVGPLCKTVQVDDDVMCVKYIANPFPFRGMNYRCVNEMNIIAIIKPK